MKIQVNTDAHISGRATRVEGVRRIVEQAFGRFTEPITRVEVHLSDENGARNGPLNQRWMLEARLQGRQPVAVTEYAASQDQALRGATDKMTHLLEHALGRLPDRRGTTAELPFAADNPAEP